MTTDIQTLIEQRPHLKDPLELYAKWQRFHHKAGELLPKKGPAMSPEDGRAYSRESAGAVFRLFASIFGLQGEDFKPLLQALEAGEIDFMRFPLDEFPAISSLPCSEDELTSILFLLSRPYFMARREAYPLDGRQWENGRCPLCSARAALSSIVEGPLRRLHCSFCGTCGPYRFIGCPTCETEDATKLNTIMSEGEPGYRIVTCDACQTYVKVVESSVLKEMTLDLADMVSLPLDIVAQGKGFQRMAPNPISLKKIE
ncbi:MAG: formate dehydrogenase accessory protein FdhE [Deltaproteobacteria bacterium]|nr:formate dehydrogenase accessory protein FdhE [Deltaproteobacteria bacterium]